MHKPRSAFTLILAALAIALALAACGGGDSGTATPTIAGTTTVTVELRSFDFVPEEFAFETGDTIAFQLDSKDIEHTFTVKELGIDWFVRAGGSPRESFTFTTPGEFELICTIPGHKEAGMVGVVRVR